MLVQELDGYFRSVFRIDDLARVDSSLNGLQVGRVGPKIEKIAFLVDACMEGFLLAAEWNADMVFAHHGLFWGKELRITGAHRRRLSYLFEKDLALYAVHLPLDMHPEVGNNAGMAKTLGLTDTEPFGFYKGFDIGIKGRLPAPLSIHDTAKLLFGAEHEHLSSLPFGKRLIATVGIISGGAPGEAAQAIEQGLDLYITGDASHTLYHQCREEGLNVISGGHYRTETWGVRLTAEKVRHETGIETRFFDIPTGL
jgi:dinuclear metal center YbgI/SA1388 family protein